MKIFEVKKTTWQDSADCTKFMLRLPIFCMKINHYDYSTDQVYNVWCLFVILFSIDVYRFGFGLRVMRGWTPLKELPKKQKWNSKKALKVVA